MRYPLRRLLQLRLFFFSSVAFTTRLFPFTWFRKNLLKSFCYFLFRINDWHPFHLETNYCLLRTMRSVRSDDDSFLYFLGEILHESDWILPMESQRQSARRWIRGIECPCFAVLCCIAYCLTNDEKNWSFRGNFINTIYCIMYLLRQDIQCCT